MTPTTPPQSNQSVEGTIWRPLGPDDEGADPDTNPGKSLMANPNPKSGVKPFHPEANCANNVG